MDALSREKAMGMLVGGLWHTTHPDRFQSIIATGAIVPNPDIQDSERWKTSAGPDNYPYVRKLGGVSLFDFEGFDANTYEEKHPLSTWYEFVPLREIWGSAVWIEIDREEVAADLISGAKLVEQWKTGSAYRHTFMPYIEAAYIGDLPRSAFLRALLIREDDQDFRDISLDRL